MEKNLPSSKSPILILKPYLNSLFYFLGYVEDGFRYFVLFNQYSTKLIFFFKLTFYFPIV